jgi:hypothetical protein
MLECRIKVQERIVEVVKNYIYYIFKLFSKKKLLFMVVICKKFI